MSVVSKPPRGAGRNAIEGTIASIEPGATHTRLTVTTPSGRSIAAAMPPRLVATRALREGLRAWACFATDSVILATFD